VREQMVADVPLGAFLSGGIDSSLIVMLMQRLATRPVKTFAIGFDDPGYDESRYAREVATRLGTDHTEFRSPASERWRSSRSAVHLRRAVRRLVAGADDAGRAPGAAARHRRADRRRRRRAVRRLPALRARAAARAAARACRPAGPRGGRDRRLLARPAEPRRHAGAGQRSLDWAAPAPAVRRRRRRRRVVRPVDEPVVPAIAGAAGVAEDRGVLPLAKDVLAARQRHRARDVRRHAHPLPDELLVKVDRAAMSTSLETRLPLLDHELVALAWRLPFATKVAGERTKLVLRHILDKQLPSSLFDRPKMGFMVPMSAWLRGPLRGWAEALLDERRMREDGYLDPTFVRRRWSAFLAGVDDWRTSLWPILMWQAWREATR
jgi:asparagine synthase (glutamine-hydrolysing)